MTTTVAPVETALVLDDEQTRAALAEHLRAHRIGADDRWDVEALRALHDLAQG